jgi:predicted transposase YbfD/YdcC
MTENPEIITMLKELSEIPDTREKAKVKHLLFEILFIIICAVICGADSPGGIRRFAISKYDWLKKVLLLSSGVPSRDTFSRILSSLDPKPLKIFLQKWLLLFEEKLGKQIAIDGKTVRHSFDKASNSKAIHLVNAWAVEGKLFLGQEKVDDKSNEITAIPKLLELLDLKGKLVSFDAMGCQKIIGKQIVSREGDYLFALKGNQGDLYENVKLIFASPVDDIKISSSKIIEKSHGKVIARKYSVINDISWLDGRDQWESLSSIAMVQTTITHRDKVSVNNRYFISSLKTNAKKLGEFIRGHWAVENCLHWVLDMTFSEDASRIRKDNSSENLSMIKKITINLIKIANNKRDKKISIKGCRECAGWNDKFLEEIIFGQKLPQTPLYIREMLDETVHHA